MIIIKIYGGLGNQMFQYAFSLHYLLKGIKVKYDLSFYDQFVVHNGFELESVFKRIRMIKATLKDVFYFAERRIENNKNKLVLKPEKAIIYENSTQEFLFNSGLQNLNDTYFSGYWQHEKYFNNYSKVLKQHFTFPTIARTETINKNFVSQISNTNSVSIHVRRGDYLHSPIHLNLSLDYYLNAMDIIKKYISAPVFFVFSDDIVWVKRNIFEKNIVFIQQEKSENSYKDMQLMSMCNHNIIANSTFSWWAAWLNNYNDKMVIAPKTWFGHPINMDGLLYKNWIVTDVK